MANFTIMRNGLNTEIVGDPHIGQSSEDVTVEVKDDGTYSGYAKRLYYSYCYHNELHRALSAVNSNNEFIIPVQAFFEPGMVKLSVELSNGTNSPACNACFLIVTDGAKDVDTSVLPSEKTWQSYIQSYIKSDVEALGKRIDNLILSSGTESSAEVIDARNGYDGTTYNTLGTAIRSQVNNLNNEIAENLEMFTTGKNLINSDTFSALGEWCNYSNGNIETSKYVTTYRHSRYIPVKPNTTYSRRYNTGTAGTVFFDSKKNFISGVQTDIFTTPETCKFLIYNTNSVREHDYHECVLIEGDEIIDSGEGSYPTPVFYNDFVKPNPDYVKKDDLNDYVKKDNLKTVVTVGTNNADFEKVGDAFAYAREHDLEVLIMPGEYDLVAEGISGNGYVLPKKVTGYNATLKCHLPNENWDLSPLNTDYRFGAFEVYGLTIDIENCRYCIHDEMGARATQTYKNVFKDLHLINRSNASDVLIAPNNIGGGCGNGGYIEITNCVMEQLGGHTKNIDYHSSFTGNQTGEVIIKMTGCCLDKKVTVSSIGSARENHNKMYVSNCKISTLPTDNAGNNFDMITWNNAQ